MSGSCVCPCADAVLRCQNMQDNIDLQMKMIVAKYKGLALYFLIRSNVEVALLRDTMNA